MSPIRIYLICLFTASLVLLSLTGCEEDVVAVNNPGLPFSLFGLITTDLDTQWVHVFPIEDRLVPTQRVLTNIEFSSSDLQTGEIRIWRDSLILGIDNTHAHVFWSPFRAAHNHTYRLVARHADDRKSAVEVSVPPAARLIVEEPYSVGVVMQPVFVQGDVPRLLRIEAVYDLLYEQIVENVEPHLPPFDTLLTSISFSLPCKKCTSKEDGGWRITLNLTDDQDFLEEMMPDDIDRPFPREMYLSSIEIKMIAANEEWDPPDGLWDAELLVQPGAMSNVDNGFGFVGAGYRLTKEWLPAREWVERAGFSYLDWN